MGKDVCCHAIDLGNRLGGSFCSETAHYPRGKSKPDHAGFFQSTLGFGLAR